MAPPKGHAPYPGCETGGAPRKYDDAFIEKLADELDEWLKDEKNCYLGKFFDIKGLNPDYGVDFSAINEKFSRSYYRAKKSQETRIYVGALNNKYNARIAEFGLMHNHGWATKAENKVTATVSLPVEIFNQTKELIDDKTATEDAERGRSSCY